MVNIKKINLFKNTTEDITMFSSALTRKLESLGLDLSKQLIKVGAECPKNENDEGIIKSTLTNMVSEGIMLENIVHDVLMAPASGVRKAETVWMNRDILALVGRWALCGLKSKDIKLAINKYMAYLGLLTSASKPFADVFGNVINIRRVAVIDDCEVIVNALADLVSKENKISYKKARKMVINALDGFGIINDAITAGKSCTIRGPWIKAFVQAAKWNLIARWCKAHGIEMKFHDFWGREVKLEDVDIILTKSCHKAATQYKDWDQYCTAFEELGHEICVCVQEHKPKLKGMPYQQGQTLLGNEDDATRFMMHAKKSVYKYHDPAEAATLLHGAHAQAAKMYPALFNEAHTKRAVQEMYTTKRNDMLGGRIPELGYNAFLAPDMMAFIQHLFGQKITGHLKAGECACQTVDEGLVDVTRNPHLDNAHCILNNVVKMPFVGKTPTMFINIFDTTTIQLRADYDGDHVWFSVDSHLLELVEKTYEILGNIPIDWDAEGTEKVQITKAAISGFVTNLIHGSEIGLYADALTKMWNSKYDRDVCDWLTYAANVLIDAAKHASVKISKPDKVKALNFVSLPLFAMYAKASADHPANTDYWLAKRITPNGIELPPRCAYSGSFLDMYSKKIQENVPETITVDGVEDMIFDPTKLMIDSKRPMIKGLWKKGTFNPVSGSYEDCGLIQEIAFRHSTEWNRLVGDTSFFNNRKEWEDETGKAARAELIGYAGKLFPTMTEEELDDACYDIFVRFVFTAKMSDAMDTVMKQCFWRVYGDKAVNVLKRNLNIDIPDFDDDEFEDLFDAE